MTLQALSTPHSASPFLRTAGEPLAWLVIAAVVAVVLTLKAAGATFDAPKEALIPVADLISAAMSWFTDHFRPFFRGITWLLSWPLVGIRNLLQFLPWSGVVLTVALLGYLANGWRLALFCALAVLYIVVTGYWPLTANTLASVIVAVPLSVLAGLFIGIRAHRSPSVRRLVEPGLDLMQTIPFFAYIIPILVLFGIGPVVGLAASAIYAIPPMVRNVMLALERVPSDIVESGRMAGSSRRQLLWWVQLPSGLPTILIGVNQTVMAGLSMVVIAAMVGGVDDIGLEVYNTMREAKFGQCLLSGLVIALLAMVADRVTRGFAFRRQRPAQESRSDRMIIYGLAVAILASFVLARLVPVLQTYPEEWRVYPVAPMNAALEWFTQWAFPVTSAIKNWVVFYLMLPLKIGLPASVRPNFWGFEMSATVSVVYCTIVAVLAGAAFRFWSWRAALGCAVVAALYYYGTTGLPWPAFALIAGMLAWSAGGWHVLLLTLGGLAFILLTGMWNAAMVSVQLTAIGVVFSFAIGAALGTWAALDDRVSAVLRPICDTLQTMPIFVFLIPAIMVFLVGEFTALIAVVMYAVVPSIRYTEHGFRNVPVEIMEASRALGTTRWQRLWQVQFPIALPEIMLGLNQTIMMALSMVVVAALVGARGLGEEVMVALNQANTGTGLVSGLSITALAIATDRAIQAWSLKRKEVLGIA